MARNYIGSATAKLDMAPFSIMHKLLNTLLSDDSRCEPISTVVDAVYADNGLSHRFPLHFQKRKNVADTTTMSATSTAILLGYLHIICM